MAPKSEKNDGLAERVAVLEVEIRHIHQAREIGGPFKRNGYWIWPLISVIITLTIGTGIVGLTLSAIIDKQIEAKLADPIRKMEQIHLDNENLKGQLKSLMEIEQGRLKQKAELGPNQLRNQLPDTTVALKSATILRVTPPANIDKLSVALQATDRNSEGYWPAVSALINYKSSLKSGVQFGDLPSCFSPQHQTTALLGTDSGIHVVYENCQIDLADINGFLRPGPHSEAEINIAEHEIIELSHGRLVYHGGPIISPQAVICHQCTYDFNSGENPSPPVRRLAEQLLAADLKSVELRPNG